MSTETDPELGLTHLTPLESDPQPPEMAESAEPPQQTGPAEPSEIAPSKPDNGPLKKKLGLLAFVAIVFIGAVTVDQLVRSHCSSSEEQELVNQQIEFINPKVKLSPNDEYRLKLKRLEELDEAGALVEKKPEPVVEVPLDPEAVELAAAQAQVARDDRVAKVFKFLGSESGTFAQVVARRLIELAHLVMMVAFLFMIYRIYYNPGSQSDARPTMTAPFTGLTVLEKAVFAGLAGLAAFQCLRKIYSPSWKTICPSIVLQVFGRIRHISIAVFGELKARIEDQFSDYTNPSARSNSAFMALINGLRKGWRNSFIRKGFRAVFPEGTFRSVRKFISQNYSHLIYAPLWLGVLLGFHMLYLYNPTALVDMAQSAVPWVVPKTFVKGLIVWVGTSAASVAASQPIYATIAAWVLVSFGIGGIVRPWNYKKRDGSAVSKYDYYKRHSLARVLHILAAVICLGLLLLCYFPQIHNVVRFITGLPLEAAMNAGYAVMRTTLYTGLQIALKAAKYVVDIMRALQWPGTSGFIPFVFTMAWNSLTIFAIYAIPKVFYIIVERNKIWDWNSTPHPNPQTEEAASARRKKEMVAKLKIALAAYIVLAILVSFPMIMNTLLYVVSWAGYILPRTWFGFTTAYSWIYTMGPILLIPPYIFLFAFQYNWVVPPTSFAHEEKKKKTVLQNIYRWARPVFVLLVLALVSIFFYAFVHYIFYPERMIGMFNYLDGVHKMLVSLVMWIIRSLSANMSWVAPFSWTFAVAGVFSLLLVFMPTFLDSKIGALLYLPAFHFLGQLLFMWTGGGINVPTALLIGALATFHVLTAVALLFRNWDIKWRNIVNYCVPYHDEFRGLVSDY